MMDNKDQDTFKRLDIDTISLAGDIQDGLVNLLFDARILDRCMDLDCDSTGSTVSSIQAAMKTNWKYIMDACHPKDDGPAGQVGAVGHEPVLRWPESMTTYQAGRYLLTTGFIAVELYRAQKEEIEKLKSQLKQQHLAEDKEEG